MGNERDRLRTRLDELDELYDTSNERLQGLRVEALEEALTTVSSLGHVVYEDHVMFFPLPGREVDFANLAHAVRDPAEVSFAETVTYFGLEVEWVYG